MRDDDDLDGLLVTLKEWWQRDKEHSAKWRLEAREDFDFVACRQWSEQDQRKLEDEGRPPIVFNRAAVIVDSICGDEIKNRQEIRFIPREPGDVKTNELLTSAGDYFRDRCEASHEESGSFRDSVICGMGWTEERVDFEGNPNGDYNKEKVDPLEMFWDCSARKGNLRDARRVWRVRQMPLTQAKAMFPGEDAGDLNAGWTGLDSTDGKEHHNRSGDSYSSREVDTDDENELEYVTLAHLQWFDRESFVRIALGGQEVELSPAEFKTLKGEMESEGLKLPPHVVQTRKAYKQAWIGTKVLGEVGPTPCPTHFSYQCITGKLDHTKGVFYGLVRALKDPQRWANKWLSQTLHILNTNATGGVMAERGAFENDADAERDWAKPNKIVWLQNGALAGGAELVKPKLSAAFPTGHYQLMEFALSSIRDVSGVNLEMLGQRAVDQPASLEYQRRQAAMTILQPLFDGLRRYRKTSGEILLYFLINNLSDGRMVRIVGDEQSEYVAFKNKPGTAEYDVIVDEVPTSPNQKEHTWGIMQSLLPMVQPMMTPRLMLELLPYTPLPETAVQRIKAVATEEMQAMQGQQGQSPEMMKAAAQIEADKAKMMAQIESANAKMAAELQGKQQAAVVQAQLDAESDRLEHERSMSKIRAEMLLKGEQMRQEMELKRAQVDAEMMLEAEIARFKAQNQLSLPANQVNAGGVPG